MTNEEHLALLRQGVEAWNAWKANHPDIRPNLSFATGKGIIIRGAKLSGVDLSRANLSRADLSKADLIGANLSEAYLSEAYLSQADLIGANLKNADLRNADLISANLIATNLSNTYLSGADLSKANLSGADLVGAKLIGAKLSGTNLSGANLKDANLSGAHLVGANLKGANLREANFSQANLSGANLQRTKALKANFNKATFTGVCLEDWQTNSRTDMSEVICDYIYLQANGKDRCPSQGKFALGEFTRLFQKPLETVNLIFRNGIDWQAFFIAFQKLSTQLGNNPLSIQAIENQNDGSLLIRLKIPPDVSKTDAELYFKEEYDGELKGIDKDYRYQLQVKYEQVATYRQQSSDLTEIVKRIAGRTINVEARTWIEVDSVAEECQDNPSDDSMGSSAIGNPRDTAQLSIPANYTPEQKHNLIEIATKILKLIQQIEQHYPTNTPLEKQIVVMEVIKRIENNSRLKSWVAKELRDVNIDTLKKLIDHPLGTVLLTALEGYQDI
ncbi:MULTISPECIES: pentapeptide repeat-containing protein [unclassified Coleofasciculus]|uniref:pentapeptide repeat-containing protein n=1 Tax=unclassified Coleofasciculus TaxID=2692782 RepID=UPI0018823B8D|nr:MULTISPECIES: pentapeptide repeat-containing protein [unclassified Coleofasciculus]MBE9130039.1 pentapeptide repeat-containing protein [Coleofasciculus sp. LEGE 07081]MBE9152389.1 pentapeptide repeat-containing protein [Coleofasciculus sp. LEGE 07092]